MFERESGLSHISLDVSSSKEYQDSLKSLRCLNEENEVSFKNQNYLGKEIQAEKNAQSEVENENMQSEEEIPDTELELAV